MGRLLAEDGGLLLFDEPELEVVETWVSPTSHNDLDTWMAEANAYDGNTGTQALTGTSGGELELTIGAMSCDKIRIYAYDWELIAGNSNPDVTISVYYDSAYHEIFSGTITKDTWVEKPIGSVETVTKAKISGTLASGHFLYLVEFQFCKPTNFYVAEDNAFSEGAYQLTIEDLVASTWYRLRAFGENEIGVGYADTIFAQTLAEGGLAKFLFDTLSIDDSLTKTISVTKADSVTIADSTSKAVGLVKSDLVVIGDTISKAIGLFKSESVAISDTLAKAIRLAKTDVVAISDTFSKAMAYVRSLSDTLGITDSISKAISITKSDAVVITDAIAVVIGGITHLLNLFDRVVITDHLEGVLRVKVYLKQGIDQIQAKGLDIAQMSIKGLGIARMQVKGLDIARLQTKGLNIAKMQIKKTNIDKTPLFRWIIRRWTA
jgi:hypothetical protein